MSESRKRIKLAINWLLNSKIHNYKNWRNEQFGSFNNYYDLQRKACPFAYTEITAYGVELLLILHEKTGIPRYLQDAKLAGDWICKMQYLGRDRNAFGSFSYNFPLPNGPKSSRFYSFDASICIGALVELYKKTNEHKFLEAAKRGAEWLVLVMQYPDGSLKPYSDYRTKNSSSSTIKWFLPKNIRMRLTWFERSGCHHGKNVIGLLKLHSVTKDPAVEDAAKKLCEWTLSQQETSGFFRVQPQSTSAFTHTHCYATEGLLYASEYFSNKRYLSGAVKGAKWLIKMQKPCGIIPDWLHGAKKSFAVDSSSLAQATRIFSILYSLTSDKAYYNAFQRCMKNLLSMQCIDAKNPDVSGGFFLSEFGPGLVKFKLPRVYSWPTIFAVHASILTIDRKSSRPLELW